VQRRQADPAILDGAPECGRFSVRGRGTGGSRQARTRQARTRQARTRQRRRRAEQGSSCHVGHAQGSAAGLREGNTARRGRLPAAFTGGAACAL